MKGIKVKDLFTSKRFVRTASVLLAGVVLGTGAWSAQNSLNNDIPQLTTFVDMDDLISISGEEVPLASAPKTTVKKKTTTSKKVVTLRKKSTKTYNKKLKPKTVKSPTVTKKTSSETTTLKRTTATSVIEKYKKNSRKKTVVTTKVVTTTTTVTPVVRNAAASQGNVNTAVSSGNVKVASSQTTSTAANAVTTRKEPYKVNLPAAAPLLDARVMKAYQSLNFDITIDSSASYAGYFSARNQSITLREESDTIYHELGHFVAFIAGNVDTKADFAAIYQKEKNSFTGSRRVYASQNASEFFAECFREYTLDPVTLKNTCPLTYEAICNALNRITDSQVAQAKMFYGSIWTK